MATFRGFSTIGRIKAPYTLTDKDLIKQDLLNQFYTKKGERVMLPNFGCIVWDVLMDPATPELEKELYEDIVRIVKGEPRVELLKASVYILDHTIRAEIDLRYVQFDSVDTLYLEYVREITEGL